METPGGGQRKRAVEGSLMFSLKAVLSPLLAGVRAGYKAALLGHLTLREPSARSSN